MNLKHRDWILIATPLVLHLVFLAILAGLIRQSDVERARQIRASGLISHSNALSKLFYDAGVCIGGYSASNRNAQFSDRYYKIKNQIPKDMEALKGLVGDSPKQQEIVQHIDKIVASGIQSMDEAKAAADQGATTEAISVRFKQVRHGADELQDQLRALTSDERNAEGEGVEPSNRARNNVSLCLVIGVTMDVLMAVALAVFARRSRTTSGAGNGV